MFVALVGPCEPSSSGLSVRTLTFPFHSKIICDLRVVTSSPQVSTELLAVSGRAPLKLNSKGKDDEGCTPLEPFIDIAYRPLMIRSVIRTCYDV